MLGCSEMNFFKNHDVQFSSIIKNEFNAVENLRKSSQKFSKNIFLKKLVKEGQISIYDPVERNFDFTNQLLAER